jgi:enoyl-CoA hydratase/carnithine racemase
VGDSVRTEFADGVAVITIDRPEARNAVAERSVATIDEVRSDMVIGTSTGAGTLVRRGA